jgi:hypothetical protein
MHLKSQKSMDATALTEKLDSLEGNIDELEEALGPLLQDLAAASSRLPLLDKAKLSILSTYALETLLFCKYSHCKTCGADSLANMSRLFTAQRRGNERSCHLPGVDEGEAVLRESQEDRRASRKTDVNPGHASRHTVCSS